MGMSIATTTGLASEIYLRSPYVGAEILQTNQNYYSNHGRGEIAKNFQNYNFFCGLNFHKNFGVEAGYTFQPERQKKTLFALGQTSLDGIVTDDNGARSRSYISGNHPYLGFFANTTVNKIKFKAMIGASFSQINVAYASVDGESINSLQYSSFKVVPLVKLISEYNVYKNFGIRLSLNYNHFSKFNIFPKFSDEANISLKNQLSVGLGFTYSLFLSDG